MTSRQNRIEVRLRADFNPSDLKVVVESHTHAGHAGAGDEGESHFYVEIVSEAFAGKSRVEAQRMINEALREEFDTGLHALRMKTKAA